MRYWTERGKKEEKGHDRFCRKFRNVLVVVVVVASAVRIEQKRPPEKSEHARALQESDEHRVSFGERHVTYVRLRYPCGGSHDDPQTVTTIAGVGPEFRKIVDVWTVVNDSWWL